MPKRYPDTRMHPKAVNVLRLMEMVPSTNTKKSENADFSECFNGVNGID